MKPHLSWRSYDAGDARTVRCYPRKAKVLKCCQPKREDTCSRQHWLYRLVPETFKLKWFHQRPQMLDMELEGAVGTIGLGTFKVRLDAFCIMRWLWAYGNEWNDWFAYNMSPTGSCVEICSPASEAISGSFWNRTWNLVRGNGLQEGSINDCTSVPRGVPLVSWSTWVVIVTHFHSYELCHDRLYPLYSQTKLNPSLEKVCLTFDHDSNKECTQKSQRGQVAIEAKSVQENAECVRIGERASEKQFIWYI